MKRKVIIAAACLVGLIVGVIGWTIITSTNSNDPIENLTAINIEYLDENIDTTNAIALTGSNSVTTISTSGTYLLSGDFTNGIIIDAKDAVVYLVLNGANISSQNGAAIYAPKSDTLYIAATKETTNIISDASVYSEAYGNEDIDAAIYTKGNLAFAGDGVISISGNSNHAIHGKDYIQILSGTLNIESANDSIVGKDYVAMKNGEVVIKSSSDGIKSTNDEESYGQIVIDGGTLTIESTGDAINSTDTISITDGELSLETGGGAKITNNSTEWGRWSSPESKAANTSAKGLKAEKSIIMTGGKLSFNTSDDAIHSNNSIQIDDGIINIKTGDDAIHADTSIRINGGKIDIAQSHEGIESSYIIINGGDIKIIDDDDGLNASGGNDSSSLNGRAEQNNFTSSTGKLVINGGKLHVISDGDGLDANGSIEMTGGIVYVDGPTNDGNGALDYDDSFNISGGALVAAGSSGMLQSASSTSSQNTVAIVFASAQAANSNFKFTDSSGNTIIDYSPSKQYASIVISAPDIKKGSTYTASVDDTTTISIEVNNILTNYGTDNRSGNMPGGGRR